MFNLFKKAEKKLKEAERKTLNAATAKTRNLSQDSWEMSADAALHVNFVTGEKRCA